MSKIINIYTGVPTYKHVLLRKVGWNLSHPRNIKFYFAPQWSIIKKHWNIQLMLIGLSKCNGRLGFRLLNWELEISW